MNFLSYIFMPFLDWIQVEVTTSCNAQCVYCPNPFFDNVRPKKHMSLETYGKLVPAFDRTSLVYLQGWGEPLLNPHFFEFVRKAKDCGCKVGMTTNGMLLSENISHRLVSEGLDVVGVSLAGTNESQDEIRRGTGISEVLSAIRRLSEAKKKAGSSIPRINLAYMWLRSRLEDIRTLPSLVEDTGINDVIVSTLDFAPTADLQAETLHARDDAEEAFLRGILNEVREEGLKRGIRLHFSIVAPNKPAGVCTEKVTGAMVVSVKGDVYPCVFRNLPNFPDCGMKDDHLRPHDNAPFGNVNVKSIPAIWSQKSYKSFRQNHSNGRGPVSCGNCPKLFCQ